MLLYVHTHRTDYKGRGAQHGRVDFHTTPDLNLYLYQWPTDSNRHIDSIILVEENPSALNCFGALNSDYLSYN